MLSKFDITIQISLLLKAVGKSGVAMLPPIYIYIYIKKEMLSA